MRGSLARPRLQEYALSTDRRDFSVTRERLAGYQDALQMARIALRDSFVIHSDFRQSGGMAAMARLLDMAKPPGQSWLPTT